MSDPGVPRRVAFGFYVALLVAGLFFYVAWGIAYGAWNPFVPENIGVYAVTVVLVAFGVVGILLYRKG